MRTSGVMPDEFSAVDLSEENGDNFPVFKEIAASESFLFADDGQFDSPICLVCDTELESIEARDKHMLKVHAKEKSLKCPQCPVMYNIEKNMDLHLILHSNSKHCPECLKVFKRTAGLKSHLIAHMVEDTIECPTCHEEFRYPFDRLVHERSKHSRQSKGNNTEENPQLNQISRYGCVRCSESFSTEKALRDHLGTHSLVAKEALARKPKPDEKGSKKNLVCQFCPKKFQRLSLLMRHERIHTGEKPFKCSECGKSFTQSNSLILHMRLHSGIFPYKCDKCPSAYAQKVNLIIHINSVHRNCKTKPLVCDVCKRAFKAQHSLVAHFTKEHPSHLISFSFLGAMGTGSLLRSMKDNESSFNLFGSLNMPVKNARNVQNADQFHNDADRNKLRGDSTSVLLSDTYASETSVNLKGKILDQISVNVSIEGNSVITSGSASQHDPIINQGDNLDNVQVKGVDVTAKKSKILDETVASAERSSEKNADDTFTKRVHLDASDLNADVTRMLTLPHKNEKAILDRLTQETETLPLRPVSKKLEIRTVIDTRTNKILEAGLLVEDGIKYSVCLKCNRRFKKVNDLVRHIRIHNKEKPFHCSKCNAAFSNNSALKKHEHIHQEPGYESNICGKKFSYKRLLRSHSLKDDNKSLPCPICKLSFPDKAEFCNHVSKYKAKANEMVENPIRIQENSENEIMDPLQIQTDEPMEVPNFVHSSYDLDAPKSNSCSTSQVLVCSFTLKEEEIMDPLQIETDEPLEVPNFVHSAYDLDTPQSNSCSTSQFLDGSFTLKEEEIADPLQIKNDEPMKVSNFSHLSCGLDTPKSSSCNYSQPLVGPFTLNDEENMDLLQIKNDEPMKISNFGSLVGSLTLKEEGSFCNGRSRKKRSRPVKDMSSSGETIRLTNVFNESKLCEKIYLKTTVEIEKLTKRTIDENCCGKWRCSACGKIENSFYFLQLHKSTNCETGLSFICEICCKEINNYSDFAIHYIEHEADKKKKCPICLYPNINDIKEHVFVENHLSEDITGFKFTDNEFQRSNQKAKPDVLFNSTIDGYCQDFNVGSLSKKTEKKVKKECQSIVESTPDVQEKPNLRKRKENTIYVESSDSDVNYISDEEMDRYSEEAYEVMSSEESDPEKIPGMMSPKSSISHVKAINRSSGKRLSQSEEVTLESFGSRWNEMSLWFRKKTSVDSSENTHVCKICSESFSLRISLSNHMKCHDEIEIQQCHFYRSKFKKKRNLDCRFETDNGTKDSSYECTICKRTYTIRKSFLNHMRRHNRILRATALNGKSASHPMYVNDRGLTHDNLNKCATCLSTYKYRNGLLRHLKCNPEHRMQPGNGTHFCNIDNKSFSTDLLCQPQREISKSNNKNEMFQYPFCQTKFNKEHHLCRHVVAHMDETCNLCIKCNMCTSSFSLPSELLNHLKMHEKTEASEKTEIAFSAQLSENSDAETTSNSEPVTNNIVRESNFNECGKCKKTYVKRRSLLRHLRRHIEGRKYLCHICGLCFFRDTDLKLHIQRHNGEKNFTCDKCGNNFYSMSLLNQHLKKHATEESGQRPEKLFECEICNTKLLTKQVYSKHMKRHTEGTALECGICRRKCYTKYHLTEHMRIHTGQKPYECKICNHSFAQIMGLRNHMKYHSDKKYSCEFCSKTFMKKDKKDDHVNIHTGNKPYKCKQCDMRFGSRKSLNKHEKSHMRNPEEKKFREKKYSCNICSEVFVTSAYRDQHVALHENPNPFSCEFCSKNFNYKKNLMAHVQRVHPSYNPFRCKLCNKTYDTIRKIDVHINSRACVKNDKLRNKSKNQGRSIEVDRNMNAENLFICNICDEEFLSVEEIQEHFNSFHRPSK